jgi:hypothetical protein
MHEISRKQKLLIFIYEYYFGYNLFIKIIRLLGGPLIFLFGIHFYKMGYDKFSIAYSGFCLLFGAYFTFKPLIWILSRWKMYESDKVMIEIDDIKINILEENIKSELSFDLFKRIRERPWYFSLILDTKQKIYLPKNILTDDQIKIIRDKSKTLINNFKKVGNP